MLILGLTGRSGSGKGYLSQVFSQYGIPSIDCDRVSKDVCAPHSACAFELAQAFGDDILENGVLQRKKLAQRAFVSEEKVALLNSITHPHILSALQTQIEGYRLKNCKAVLLDAPTLFESGLHRQCDVIICVTSSDKMRLNRIKMRDSLSEEDAKLRLQRQKSDAEFRALSDFEIINDGACDLATQVTQILNQLHLLS